MKSPILKEGGTKPFVTDKDRKDKDKKEKDNSGMATSPVTGRSLTVETAQTLYLPAGAAVKLRLIQPEDQRLIKEMFAGLSKETIYYRYFGYVPPITPEFLMRFACVNPEREVTIVAETKVNGVRQIIGVVQVVKDGDGTKAEFGILIADDWQKQGLGSLMTDFTRQVVANQGVQILYAHFMAINRGIAGLLQKQGFQVCRDHFDAFYAELNLLEK
ncbi:MAG: GNAT family N-acetyltransferase [Saprospiraceae bacterium]